MNIGITGSIACGKSTVSNYLKEKGYTIIDADKVGHDVLFDKKIKEELVDAFGKDIIEEGEVRRERLGRCVFGNKEKLSLLNSIIHPEIKKLVIKEQKEHKDEDLVFLDAALLFEASFDTLVDKTIVVTLDEKTQLERLMKRNNLTTEDALKRIKSQMRASKKAKLGDYIVDNSFSLENTYNQIENIIQNLKE